MSKWDVFATPEAQAFFAKAGRAMNAKMERDIARIMGEAMANEQDRRLVYMGFALTPAALMGGPVVLGFEE